MIRRARVVSFVVFAGFAGLAGVVGGCSDDDKAGGASEQGLSLLSPLPVTDVPHSAAEASDLPGHLNAETALAKLVVDAALLPTPKTARLARLSSGIDTCIAKKIADLPVSVTSDSLRLEYGVDLTALCDEAPKATDETVTEVSNEASGLIVLSCVGGNFRRFDGKTYGEIRGNVVCADAEVVNFAFSMRYVARKVVKSTTTTGSGADAVTTETLTVTAEDVQTVWAKADGSACKYQRGEDKKKYTTTDCRLSSVKKSFSGKPEDEGKAPTEAGGPVVVGTQADFGALTYETGAPYYSSGQTAFYLNGWSGVLTYGNGWAAPRWEAVKEGVTATGTLGQTALTGGTANGGDGDGGDDDGDSDDWPDGDSIRRSDGGLSAPTDNP